MALLFLLLRLVFGDIRQMGADIRKNIGVIRQIWPDIEAKFKGISADFQTLSANPHIDRKKERNHVALFQTNYAVVENIYFL